jgi:RimJ/RimL family protein N-acetyltransferase
VTSLLPVHEDVVPERLREHWADRLGATAEQVAHLGAAATAQVPPVVVVGSARRTEPGWDGAVRQMAAVVDPSGRALVSVPPDAAEWAHDLVAQGVGLDGLRQALPERLGLPGSKVYRATYRWTTAPVSADVLADVGRWLPADDPRVPEWLLPFGGDVLVVLDDDTYVAGVGLKRHDDRVHEIAVGTEEAARGRGLARRLVAQVARHLLASGVVPTYLHDPGNVASARVATAAGLPDRGWAALGIAERS